MLTIRGEQMAEFERDAREQFHRRLLVSFRKHLKSRMDRLDDAEILRRIAEADRKAQTYGIVTEKGIGQFAGLSFISGPRFDEKPKTNKFLKDPRIDPHHKIDILVDFLAESARDAGGG